MDLDQIGIIYGTDKSSKEHDFLSFYERRLSHLREEKFVLLEIGVHKGGSAATWAQFFPSATIVGLDIEDSCKQHETDRIKIRIGDASNTGFLFEVLKEFGNPLIVVDDGSHWWDHQILSLQTLFPIIQPGGLFIMEDLDTSFNGYATGGSDYKKTATISAFDYLTKLSRVVVAGGRLGDEKPYDLFIQDNAAWVGSVELGRRTSVISKKQRPTGGPI